MDKTPPRTPDVLGDTSTRSRADSYKYNTAGPCTPKWEPKPTVNEAGPATEAGEAHSKSEGDMKRDETGTTEPKEHHMPGTVVKPLPETPTRLPPTDEPKEGLKVMIVALSMTEMDKPESEPHERESQDTTRGAIVAAEKAGLSQPNKREDTKTPADKGATESKPQLIEESALKPVPVNHTIEPTPVGTCTGDMRDTSARARYSKGTVRKSVSEESSVERVITPKPSDDEE